MKLIFVTGTMMHGGAERVISILASRLLKYYEIDIICYFSAPIFYDIDSRVNIIDMTKLWNCNNKFSKLRAFRRYIKSQNNAIVIAFMMPFYILSAIALLGVKVPFIAAERNDPNSASKVRKILSKILLPKYDVLVAQTIGAKSFFEGKTNCDLRVIYNPVNPALINTEHNDPGFKHFVSMARFYPQKNQRLLISAFRNVLDVYPDCRLTIYGEGPLREQLESQINNLGLNDYVSLPGVTNNIIEALGNASVYVCSSDYEGMPNSVIEAMVCGVPTISTKVMGAVDLIENGENGLLVNVGNEDELSDAMIKLISDKELRYKLSNKARDIADVLDTDNIVNQWIDTIDSIVKK